MDSALGIKNDLNDYTLSSARFGTIPIARPILVTQLPDLLKVFSFAQSVQTAACQSFDTPSLRESGFTAKKRARRGAAAHLTTYLNTKFLEEA